MNIKKWTIEEETGYKPLTTFWDDFSIADHYGSEAIKETYQRAFNEWKTNYKYLTELIMVLNWKIWQFYEEKEAIGRLYNDLWGQADQYAVNNLKGKELEYFYSITD